MYVCVWVCIYSYLLLIQRNNEDRFKTRFSEPETKQLHGTAVRLLPQRFVQLMAALLVGRQ
jgi:hypothetical protein